MTNHSIQQNTRREAVEALGTLEGFISKTQLSAIGSAFRSEEKQFFYDKLVALADLVANIPQTYEQDGKGDQAIVYLHYFKGAMDFYITEKDSDPDGEGQIQAFGLSNLGHGTELGYISISELIQCGIELDLYFTPCTLAELKRTQQ